MALYTVNGTVVVSPADVNQFTNLLNGTTTNTQVTVSNRVRAAFTGATSGSGGYVGQVAGGAPASGTFVVGDYVTDGTFGTHWVCVAGGTPGTWSMLPTQIATTTLNSTVATVTFSSIPAFNHVKLIWKARGDAAVTAQQMYLRLNGDTANHYLWANNQEHNTTVTGQTSGGLVSFIQIATITGSSATAGYFGAGEFTIAEWSDTTNNASGQGTAYSATSTTDQWNGTYGGMYTTAATLTSLTLLPNAGNFVAGSQFSLYGWM